MTDYLKQTFKTDLALAFAESFAATSKDNYFLFMGRPNPWTDPNDDNNPPVPVDNLSTDM